MAVVPRSAPWSLSPAVAVAVAAMVRAAMPDALAVPAAAVDELEQRLRETLTLPFTLTHRDPLPEERHLVPTVPTRNRLLAPFALLVHQYGIPRYGEIDPTPLFAATFLLMFGTMFGDVGQGAVIAGLAWYFRSKLGRFYLFGLMAGISSIIFGFLFGSECAHHRSSTKSRDGNE
jgi:V/A-type H+-transporting ATPase subunit I